MILYFVPNDSGEFIYNLIMFLFTIIILKFFIFIKIIINFMVDFMVEVHLKIP